MSGIHEHERIIGGSALWSEYSCDIDGSRQPSGDENKIARLSGSHVAEYQKQTA
ncbi:hypothetical protein [Candidatus Kuenenia stuttgartiensis]|uniref:hypothetical protein n=1 Tax=Kuenenia stuttgartiensis TaxID=174633 RepID=UPI00146A8216|nr:hypothetical protein [Candidatus Kuenenia stuttgartiensis]